MWPEASILIAIKDMQRAKFYFKVFFLFIFFAEFFQPVQTMTSGNIKIDYYIILYYVLVGLLLNYETEIVLSIASMWWPRKSTEMLNSVTTFESPPPTPPIYIFSGIFWHWHQVTFTDQYLAAKIHTAKFIGLWEKLSSSTERSTQVNLTNPISSWAGFRRARGNSSDWRVYNNH